METTIAKKVDTADLEQKVKQMYCDVALNPTGEYRFEMGRGLAEKLGHEKPYIEKLPFEDSVFEAVISNGVINLSADKQKVFTEVARVLKPKGIMVIADIVTEKQLPENVVCNSTLWAACIGGASHQGASKDYGVKSVSLIAEKQ